MTVTVMITTRNRCDDLRRTLTHLRALDPQPDEILVCADGCDDNTTAMVTEEFPEVELIVHAQPLGSVGSRRELLERARGGWVLSLDDDSYPLDPEFLRKAAAVAAARPEAVVITFPELRDGGFAHRTPDEPGCFVAAYPNCAALMDREFYLGQAGFPGHFVHMYEETDYALQCYAAGRGVWFEPGLTVRHHLSSVQREPVRRHHQNARNELWSVWMRCPWPWLPLVAGFRVWRQFRYAASQGVGWALREPLWWLQAVRGLATCWRLRQPVSWARYLGWMRLARRPLGAEGFKPSFGG